MYKCDTKLAVIFPTAFFLADFVRVWTNAAPVWTIQMRIVRPKKALGQHFLKDLGIAEAIADTVDCCATLPILEIGPGTGVLTQFLLAKGRRFKAVELDRDSVAFLKTNFTQLGDGLVEGDFLKLDLRELFGGSEFVLTGNYPYNISSQIFFKMLDNRDLIPCCTGMLQREVAQRICAAPGSRAYGILSVLLQVWYDAEYLFQVRPDVFDPPPKVFSAVIRLRRNGRTELGCNPVLFKRIVKGTFNQRRKMIRNSIRSCVEADTPLPEGIWMEKRPEQLSVQDFIDLTNLVESCRG